MPNAANQTHDPLPLEELVSLTTIEAAEPDAIDQQQLGAVLQQYSFAIIRGLISADEIRAAKARLRAAYTPDNDHPATGESPDQIMDNFQKLSIGGAEHSGTYRPRCMRTFYNPVWAEDVYGLRSVFRRLAQVRNVMYGMPRDYAIDAVEDGFWTAARIHHYPAGGGFLVSHVDDVVPVVQEAEGIPRYFQPVLIMSRKGHDEDCDFATGGGFFEVGGERYYYEAACELGDIVIYSGETVHGVADIDLDKTFDPRRFAGRLAGFVTLYKHFTRKGELETYVGRPRTVY